MQKKVYYPRNLSVCCDQCTKHIWYMSNKKTKLRMCMIKQRKKNKQKIIKTTKKNPQRIEQKMFCK